MPSKHNHPFESNATQNGHKISCKNTQLEWCPLMLTPLANKLEISDRFPLPAASTSWFMLISVYHCINEALQKLQIIEPIQQLLFPSVFYQGKFHIQFFTRYPSDSSTNRISIVFISMRDMFLIGCLSMILLMLLRRGKLKAFGEWKDFWNRAYLLTDVTLPGYFVSHKDFVSVNYCCCQGWYCPDAELWSWSWGCYPLAVGSWSKCEFSSRRS